MKYNFIIISINLYLYKLEFTQVMPWFPIKTGLNNCSITVSKIQSSKHSNVLVGHLKESSQVLIEKRSEMCKRSNQVTIKLESKAGFVFN